MVVFLLFFFVFGYGFSEGGVGGELAVFMPVLCGSWGVAVFAFPDG